MRLLCEDWLMELPLPELTPSSADQVVFKGDVLSLSCRVRSSDYHVNWYHDGRPFVADRDSGELQQSYADAGRHGVGVVSTVRLERLRPRHSGNWTCEASTSLGRTSRFASVRYNYWFNTLVSSVLFKRMI